MRVALVAEPVGEEAVVDPAAVAACAPYLDRDLGIACLGIVGPS